MACTNILMRKWVWNVNTNPNPLKSGLILKVWPICHLQKSILVTMCEFCSILLQSDVIVTFKYRFWDQSANFSPYHDITYIQNWQFQRLISAFFTPLPPYRKIVTLKCGNPQDCSKLSIMKKIKADFYCFGLENLIFFSSSMLGQYQNG